MKREPTDTFTPAAHAIIARLLSPAAPAGMAPRCRAELERGGAPAAAWSFGSMYVEFERAGTNITLNINTKDTGSYRREPERNAAGDEFYPCAWEFGVNWPCHGTCDPATAAGRLAFYAAVTGFAAELHAEFAGRSYHRAGRTAAEQAAAAEAEGRRIAAEVAKAVEANCKGLRLGQSTPFFAAPAIPQGIYQHAISDRHYKLSTATADGGTVATITRTEASAPAVAPGDAGVR